MRVAVLTTGRQDWDILRSTCHALAADERVALQLLVGGMHHAPRFGRTIEHVRGEGLPIAAELDWMAEGEDALGEAARCLAQVGAALHEVGADALVLVGDRYETAAAAIAATIAAKPIVHLHGGEETEGAIDNVLRHATTKLSHLHLVSHQEYARRVIAMGEHPSTVHVVGAPGLDNLRRTDLATDDELNAALGMELGDRVVVVTVHPTTLGEPLAEARAVCGALNAVDAQYVITLPNADPGNAGVRELMLEAAARPGRVAAAALGGRRYWALLRRAAAVIGNSSSGVIETPVLGVPTVNVGDRQRGRRRAQNIIDVPPDMALVAAVLERALSPEFAAVARATVSELGDGRAGERIAALIAAWQPPRPPRKTGVA